jgi:hypothetical protein
MTKEHSFYHLAYPMFSGKLVRPSVYQIQGDIQGTCISIGANTFVTAGHVAKELESRHEPALVGIFAADESHMWAAPIESYEHLRCDLSLVRIEAPHAPYSEQILTLAWSSEPLGWCDNVETYGYAYGLHQATRTTVLLRAFKGYVVCDPTDFTRSGESFHAYELSFGVPRGLSGAPLFTHEKKLLVHGVIIGNSSSSMLVFDSKEVEQRTGHVVRVERYESLNLGIAVHGREVLGLESKLLRGTIGAHLQAQKKLVSA